MKKKLVFIPIVGLLLSGCSLEDLMFWKKFNKGGLQEISVKSEPTKTTYFETELFNPNGLVINATYSSEVKEIPYNGNESDFTFSIALDRPLTRANRTMSVTYKEKSTTFELNIKEVTSINKTKLTYTYDDYMENSYYGLDNCPLVGQPKLLVIPIWFNDSDSFIDVSKKDTVKEDIWKAYVGNTSDTGWHSVKTYYETESFNKLHLNATVTDWYTVNESYTVYAPESASSETVSLVEAASDYYFNNHSSDSRRNYDYNGDGYLDGVILIYAAPDYDSLGDDSCKNLWAYCYWTNEYANKTSPTAKTFFWASYDFLYGSNAALKTGSSYARGYTENGVKIDTHCLIHEMGHVFGLEDYYDYSEYAFNAAGGFSMQDSNVGGHDPYSVMAYGWADPYIPDKTMTISIRDFQSTHDIILLANHSDIDSPFDEYLLLEYYTPTGLNELDSTYAYREYYPQGPEVAGIRLWHVDARLFSNYPTVSNLTTNPTTGNVRHAMSNTYAGDYASAMGSQYYNYNILQLIRNDIYSTYTPKDNLRAGDLFYDGSTFNMNKFSNQFVNTTKMNDNKDLGWSFKVELLTDSNAIITLTKA